MCDELNGSAKMINKDRIKRIFRIMYRMISVLSIVIISLLLIGSAYAYIEYISVFGARDMDKEMENKEVIYNDSTDIFIRDSIYHSLEDETYYTITPGWQLLDTMDLDIKDFSGNTLLTQDNILYEYEINTQLNNIQIFKMADEVEFVNMKKNFNDFEAIAVAVLEDGEVVMVQNEPLYDLKTSMLNLYVGTVKSIVNFNLYIDENDELIYFNRYMNEEGNDLIAELDKSHRKLILQIIDNKDLIMNDFAFESFKSGFNLATEILNELNKYRETHTAFTEKKLCEFFYAEREKEDESD